MRPAKPHIAYSPSADGAWRAIAASECLPVKVNKAREEKQMEPMDYGDKHSPTPPESVRRWVDFGRNTRVRAANRFRNHRCLRERRKFVNHFDNAPPSQ